MIRNIWAMMCAAASLPRMCGDDPACAYCTMIASRGFDYHRLETAKAAMHDHCGCQPCPQWDAKKCYISGYDEDALRDQYKQAVKAVDKDRQAYLDNLHANGREN